MRIKQQPVSVTSTAMPQPEKIAHAVLILATFGLWYPVYRSRLRWHREHARTYRT